MWETRLDFVVNLHLNPCILHLGSYIVFCHSDDIVFQSDDIIIVFCHCGSAHSDYTVFIGAVMSRYSVTYV